MATEKKADYMVDNGTDFDQIMFKTTAEQVRYSKDSSGEETTVKDKIDTLNDNFVNNYTYRSHQTITDANRVGSGIMEVYNDKGTGNLPSGVTRGMVISFVATGNDVIYQLLISYDGAAYVRSLRSGISYGTWVKL